MIILPILLAAVVIAPQAAVAQNAAPGGAGTFETVTIGEPMANLRPVLGDPIRIFGADGSEIWRYLTHGDGVYLDVLVKDNFAQSITVISRMPGVRYVDPKGLAFGMTPDDVKAKLGKPSRESTNADDRSLDLWYRAMPYAWIYEFHENNLDFIQLVASPDLLSTFHPGPVVVQNDGTSLTSAIWIRPSSLVTNTVWIDDFLATNDCGKDGHWKETSFKMSPDEAKNDPLAFIIVHATCTDGSTERDFYFDTHGMLTMKGNEGTIYVDPSQLPHPEASPSPSR